MLTGSAEQGLDGSGKAWGRRIDGRGPAAGGGRRRRCGRCRARGSFGFCRDDQGDEAELMACSGRGSYGQGHGQLELELGSNGGSREKEGIREEGKNRGGEWIGEALGSLSPSSPARTGGQAGTQVRGRAGGGGGHLLLPTGAGKGTSGEMGWAWLGRQVSFSHFLFFGFSVLLFIALLIISAPKQKVKTILDLLKYCYNIPNHFQSFQHF